MSETEKLIELVRERQLLYDLSNIDYKNREKKAEAWLEIARGMGGNDGSKWSSKWKSLRDNYNKFKKNTESSSGQVYKKYKNWPWADQMRFLDDFNVSRTSKRNINSRIRETNRGDVKSSIIKNLDLISLDELQVSAHEISENCPGSKSRKRKMKISSVPTGQQILECSKTKNEQKSKLDRVDFFFLGYAQTFKNFPSKMQIILKLELANLFARYELYAEGATSTSISRMIPQTVQRGFDLSSTLQDLWDSPLSVSSTELERPRSATPNSTTSTLEDFT